MDIRNYWRTVREVEEKIPGNPEEPVYIVSITNESTGQVGGRVSVANRVYAARWIAQGSHKLANPAQIAAYERDQKERVEAMTLAELKSKQTVRLETAIPTEQLQQAVEAALASQKLKSAKPEKPATAA